MIIVTGTITATAETFERVRDLSLRHVRASREEPGCLRHGVAIDAEHPLRFVFFEEWTDRTALMTHFREANVRRLMAALDELGAVTTGPEIHDVAAPPAG